MQRLPQLSQPPDWKLENNHYRNAFLALPSVWEFQHVASEFFVKERKGASQPDVPAPAEQHPTQDDVVMAFHCEEQPRSPCFASRPNFDFLCSFQVPMPRDLLQHTDVPRIRKYVQLLSCIPGPLHSSCHPYGGISSNFL